MTQTAHRAWMAHAIPLGLMAGLGFVAFEMLAAGSQLAWRDSSCP